MWPACDYGLAGRTTIARAPLLAPEKDPTRPGGRRGIFAAVEHRQERILVETDRYRITGFLRLPRDGYRSRLTDFLNSSERSFLALTDAEVAPLDGSGGSRHRPFLALSLSHVILVMPAEQAE
jgi:hypothetical protein